MEAYFLSFKHKIWAQFYWHPKLVSWRRALCLKTGSIAC